MKASTLFVKVFWAIAAGFLAVAAGEWWFGMEGAGWHGVVAFLYGFIAVVERRGVSYQQKYYDLKYGPPEAAE